MLLIHGGNEVGQIRQCLLGGKVSKVLDTHILCGVALPVEPVLQLEADGPELLRVLDPGALHHPDGAGGALATDHEEGGAARLVESVIDKVTLLPGPK